MQVYQIKKNQKDFDQASPSKVRQEENQTKTATEALDQPIYLHNDQSQIELMLRPSQKVRQG